MKFSAVMLAGEELTSHYALVTGRVNIFGCAGTRIL